MKGHNKSADNIWISLCKKTLRHDLKQLLWSNLFCRLKCWSKLCHSRKLNIITCKLEWIFNIQTLCYDNKKTKQHYSYNSQYGLCHRTSYISVNSAGRLLFYQPETLPESCIQFPPHAKRPSKYAKKKPWVEQVKYKHLICSCRCRSFIALKYWSAAFLPFWLKCLN